MSRTYALVAVSAFLWSLPIAISIGLIYRVVVGKASIYGASSPLEYWVAVPLVVLAGLTCVALWLYFNRRVFSSNATIIVRLGLAAVIASFFPYLAYPFAVYGMGGM
jgi:hypothetical protein